MDDIESGINKYTAILNSLCPYFHPILIPTIYYQSNTLKYFIKLIDKEIDTSFKDNSSKHILSTEFNYKRKEINILNIQIVDELTYELSSIENILKIFTIGEESKILLLCNRFVELNDWKDKDITIIKHKVNQVYNIAFSMKILISNIKDIKVNFLGQSIVEGDINIRRIIKKLINKSQSKSKSVNVIESAQDITVSDINTIADKVDSDSDSDSDSDDNDNNAIVTSKKKRKRKPHSK